MTGAGDKLGGHGWDAQPLRARHLREHFLQIGIVVPFTLTDGDVTPSIGSEMPPVEPSLVGQTSTCEKEFLISLLIDQVEVDRIYYWSDAM